MDMRNPAAGQSDCQQTGRLQNTLQTTDHLLQHREAVLRLLKPDTRPAVPVAPEGQAQLLTFLQQAARQEHHDVVGLSWLSALHAEPASWHQATRPHVQIAEGMQQLSAGLDEQLRALGRYRSNAAQCNDIRSAAKSAVD